MTQLRLVYAHQHPVPSPATEELQLLQTADGFAELGNLVTLMCPGWRGEPAAAEALLGRSLSPNLSFARIAHTGKWFRSKRPFLRKLAQRIRSAPPDAVYVRNYRLAAWLIECRLGCPIFFEAHELRAQAFKEESERMNWRVRRVLTRIETLERFVYTGVAGLVCLTQGLLDDIRSAYAIRAPGLVAPDGVDLKLAGLALESAAMPESRTLLFLGTLHAWKGLEVLLHAMTQISDAVLSIAGGPQERIADLQALAAKLGVLDRVRFLGFIPPAQRFHAIARSEICLLPSSPTSIGSRYTSPLKLFEYMSMGKPIVAGDYPAMREVLCDGETALLVSGSAPEKFAQAIVRLLEDRTLRQHLGENARRLALRYSWQERAATITAFIREVAENRPQVRAASP
jgi:glycosyltransferase involved in cell wall biosynthesis